MRRPTNTLILTKLPHSLLVDPQELLDQLHGYLIEVIVLSRFQRILLICESATISQYIREILPKSFPDITISYSICDNAFKLNNHDRTVIDTQFDDMVEKQYLELPSEKASRRFLISPPLSPPSGWDHWDKVEEGPNQQTVYSFEELSHLLWQRLGDQEEVVTKVQGVDRVNVKKEPELLFKDIEHIGVPAIILDSIDGDISDETLIPKTSLPPPLNI
ncbi:uncharacterized protein SPAPADRAFT_63157 [Spathaspora passalidarum NRRL Y-27907]|uniref:Calcipressin n=1 Tax=Spathaspora passalidarum (strain NRRL Y-27907 / 11-Y1) TaxID=619300 RepID=G3ATT0_SPAPN|nr:uncharacterized protein SPAPADRAFT_63157 [Spathaspora passalidarum NRRL Y-27907]EGW30306.1 hypothetical protein SPAPADRAFT_63157 [Spathaspora passalidarum NRRL Y-27907]